MSHWLVKSEPSVYAWDALVKDKKTGWDGVRNFEARNNLRAMKKGDLCLYYHSNEGKEVVGVAKVVREGYPDATAPDEDWTSVDLAPAFPLAEPVSLAAMKAAPALAKMQIVTRPRISVIPVTAAEFAAVLRMGKTKAPG
jgi:predicted RNA-binding protein with PUA-like domain